MRHFPQDRSEGASIGGGRGRGVGARMVYAEVDVVCRVLMLAGNGKVWGSRGVGALMYAEVDGVFRLMLGDGKVWGGGGEGVVCDYQQFIPPPSSMAEHLGCHFVPGGYVCLFSSYLSRCHGKLSCMSLWTFFVC